MNDDFYNNKQQTPLTGDVVKTPHGNVLTVDCGVRVGHQEQVQIGLMSYWPEDLILVAQNTNTNNI